AEPSVYETAQNQTPTWSPPAQPEEIAQPQPEPTPTFMPEPVSQSTEIQTSASLPATNTSQQESTGIPSAPETQPAVQPSWTNTETAPTDLSHLITNNNTSPQSVDSNPETVVVPPAQTPEVPNVSTENHKKLPLWLIGVGIGLLILVAGASAYFILGIGQASKPTTSLPATTTTNTSTATPPAATPIAATSAQPSEQPGASSSSNFGELGGSNASPQASSAAQILLQRQGR
ncbi:MAG: hypothetical protein UT54_C0042G0001, partial [Candidatus Daviesbacteria bacterium GW2011_GWB1_39_5]